MKKSVRIMHFGGLILIAAFALLLLIKPEYGRSGIARGLMLCGNIVIPSLYPFTFCVIFIMNSSAANLLRPFSSFIRKVFKMNSYALSVFLLSLIGGYPVGARLLEQGAHKGNISPFNASVLLNCSVNAGPAFIITAVGVGVFASKTVGIILFISHITASVLLLLLFKGSLIEENEPARDQGLPFSDNLVISAAAAAKSITGICGFVVLFSAINSYIVAISARFEFLKGISLMLEITNTLGLTRNLYAFAFLLGFGGLCVWFQVLSCCQSFKPNLSLFALSRLLHGGISIGMTLLLVKIFKISVGVALSPPALSFVSTPALFFALLLMAIIFLLSLSAQKYNCKLSQDVV